ncbi:hypothetical protein A2U01_0052323, partial [Trifolium medium]|nr:hypothetical protein [Trifolium medium]
DATLRQFAPPYEAPCESDEHPLSDSYDTDQNDEDVEFQKIDVEGVEDIDQSRFYHFDVKITSAIPNTSQVLERQNTSSKYVLKVNPENISITNVDTREV